MTNKQYSDIQRVIGFLEGIGASLTENVATFYFDQLEVLNVIVEEMREEADNA